MKITLTLSDEQFNQLLHYKETKKHYNCMQLCTEPNCTIGGQPMKSREIIFYERMEDEIDTLITVMRNINNNLEELADAIREK